VLDIRINLLPDNKRPYLLYLAISLLAVVILALAALAVREYVDLRQKSARLAEEISETRAMYQGVLHQWEQANENINETNFFYYYDTLATELENFWIPPDQLMREITRLLPPGAKIENMKFFNNGDMNLLIRFAGKGEVADYLDRLDAAKLVLKSELVSVNADDGPSVLAQLNVNVAATKGDADE
jgi:hypothetical protein